MKASWELWLNKTFRDFTVHAQWLSYNRTSLFNIVPEILCKKHTQKYRVIVCVEFLRRD
jgi:hypothetical protein